MKPNAKVSVRDAHKMEKAKFEMSKAKIMTSLIKNAEEQMLRHTIFYEKIVKHDNE